MTSRSRGVLGVWALLRESHGVDLELGWHWCASHNSLLESIRFSATRVCSTNVCDHDEISESNTVAGSKLATVMGQVTLHQLVERGTDADNFGVEFPQELPVAAKALLLAAVFLIDFM